MCKIIKINGPREGPPIDDTTDAETLDMISQIAWEDPEAFFTLAANCLSYIGTNQMLPRVKTKLLQMNLIDRLGCPSTNARYLVLDIIGDMSESLINSAIESQKASIC